MKLQRAIDKNSTHLTMAFKDSLSINKLQIGSGSFEPIQEASPKVDALTCNFYQAMDELTTKRVNQYREDQEKTFGQRV